MMSIRRHIQLIILYQLGQLLNVEMVRIVSVNTVRARVHIMEE